MPTLLASDVFALVDADLGATLGAHIGHLPCGGCGTVAVAGRCGVAVAVHLFLFFFFFFFLFGFCGSWNM